MTNDDDLAPGSAAPEGTVRLALHRAVAVLKADSITVRPSRAGWMGPLVQALLAIGAVWLIVRLIDELALWALAVLLLVAMISGPLAVLGLVYNVAGANFLVERRKGTARWQQGFLGLGLGTQDLVPFSRIKRIEVESDAELRLSSGDSQDVIRWVVRLVKDNDRAIEIASVMAPRSFEHEGAERANLLADAVARMTGAEALPTPVPDEAPTDGSAAPERAARGRRRYRRVGDEHGGGQ